MYIKKIHLVFLGENGKFCVCIVKNVIWEKSAIAAKIQSNSVA